MLSGSLAGAYVVGFAAVRSETAFHEIPAVLQFFHQKLSAILPESVVKNEFQLIH
jgi:hypothetical protein